MTKLQELRIEWTKAKKNGDAVMMRIIEGRAKMLPKRFKPVDKTWSDLKEVFGNNTGA